MDTKGTHGTCPVVRVKAEVEGGFTEINKSDHDANPDQWELFEEGGTDYAKWTKAKLQGALRGADIEFDADAKKDDLVALAIAGL